MAAAAKKRQCAEACLEFLAIETVRHYSAQPYGPPAAGAVEAIGFRVGRQLVERQALQPVLLLHTAFTELWVVQVLAGKHEIDRAA
jgi:hypothetical protein